MKALEHCNTGMKFALNGQSGKIKLLPRSSSRVEMGFSKDKTTAKLRRVSKHFASSFVQLDHTTSQ